MPKPFSSSAATQLEKKAKEVLRCLEDAERLDQSFDAQIKKAAADLAKEEYTDILRSTLVEDILKELKGTSKALRAKGYYSLYQLANATISQIASVKGISKEKAEKINEIAQRHAQGIRRDIKIQLSTDKKTPYSSYLICLVDSKMHALIFREKASQYLAMHELELNQNTKQLHPGTGFFSWLFASTETRRKAVEAYSFLDTFFRSSYGIEAQNLIYEFEAINQLDASKAWTDFSQNSIRFFNILEKLVPELLGKNDEYYGLSKELINSIQNQPLNINGLECILRLYQEWGVKYILHQRNVLLGDEMGLGKTVEAIASMVSLKNSGDEYFIVVCPASVLTNWCREIKEKSNLPVYKVHGQDKITALSSWAYNGGVAVTTYETTSYFQFECNFRFSLLVVDEAHYIKNPLTQRTGNVKALFEHADRLLFMTGTALENKTKEMVALISMLQPQIAQRISNLAFMGTSREFRKMIAPVYCRRKREDVLTELPDMVESKEWCSLSPLEKQAYENSVMHNSFMEIRRVSWNIDNLYYSSKAKRLIEIIEEAETDGRKIIVFSFFLDTIKRISDFLGYRCMQPITGSVAPPRRQEIIDVFEQAPAGSVLCAQIQTGGTGLNIQCASVVIICEPQLKPSIENQAISRSYRMGQTRKVLVYRLLSEGTIDEKIIDLLEQKQIIFDTFADKAESAKAIKEIDDKTLESIVREERERIITTKTSAIINEWEEEKHEDTEALLDVNYRSAEDTSHIWRNQHAQKHQIEITERFKPMPQESQEKKAGISTKDIPRTSRRSRFRFSLCGIAIGEEVTFVNDESMKAIVVDDYHVRFGAEIISLSALAKRLLGYKNAVNGTLYFKYNGKILDDIRK